MSGKQELLLVESSSIPRTEQMRKKNWVCVYPGCNVCPKSRYNLTAHVWDAHLREECSKPGNNPNNLALTTFKLCPQKEIVKKMCQQYMVKMVDKLPPDKSYSKDSKVLKLANNVNVVSNNILCNKYNTATNSPQNDYPFAFNVSNEAETTSNEMSEKHHLVLTPPNSVTNDIQYVSQHSQEVLQNVNLAPVTQITRNIAKVHNVTPITNFTSVTKSQQNEMTPQTLNYNLYAQNQNIYAPQAFDPKEDFIRIETLSSQMKQLHIFGEIFAENGFLVRSDMRSKTNITAIKSALESIMSLSGVTYSYKDDLNNRKYGFIAQEVEKIIPDLVTKDDTGNLSVDYLGVLPVLLESLKQIRRNVSFTRNEKDKIINERVSDAISELEAIIRSEEKEKIDNAEKFKNWKTDALHLFGPVPILLLGCIVSSLVSIFVPVVFGSMYFVICGCFLFTIVLWVFVICNKNEIMQFLGRKKYLPLGVFQCEKFKLSHYVMWFFVFSYFFIAIILSTCFGIKVSLFAIIYLILAFVATVGCYFVAKAGIKFGFRFEFSIIVLALYQIIAILVLILLAVYQPFLELEVANKSYYTVSVTENEEVSHILMPKVPWNCFSPTIKTTPNLPDGLEFSISQKLFSLPAPVLSGNSSREFVSQVFEVQLLCNRIVAINYPSLTITSCSRNTDPTQCAMNSCGYCKASTNAFCGICGKAFESSCIKIAGKVSGC
ncbi:hypothetical protein EIN_247070 [Entamoeba invadens IP1]|uniref:Peptidase S74 domain-containing protein n=1 Tax=Entamoeba invadens IP1 TaxID=370355 RepID=A0A0A1UE99_ENTIV|nr:hypothetical protein EIN_247070 [Entamoeba invadens IP1]ELP94813.1 hypothetical protein EIN_247070 [Entamoeba invadens IP1]|eukprot:XP_004261584.1 hypothetical protein EIN_247070 [Entamoeba invadens IP1]